MSLASLSPPEADDLTSDSDSGLFPGSHKGHKVGHPPRADKLRSRRGFLSSLASLNPPEADDLTSDSPPEADGLTSTPARDSPPPWPGRLIRALEEEFDHSV